MEKTSSKILFLYILLNILLVPHCISQKAASIWYFGKYFGNNAGLDFSQGNPTVRNDSQLSGSAAPGVVSDTTGELLFYTDGISVRDSRHSIMPHGHDIFGGYGAQTNLIVPKPLNPNIYYLFTLNYDRLSNMYSLYSTKIDMELNNGFGDVVASEKNIFIRDNLAHRLTAVPHGNSNDMWVITHENGNNNFVLYRLSSSSIIDSIKTSIGEPYTITDNQIPRGFIKPSPDGTKIAATISNSFSNSLNSLNLFEFNDITGEIHSYQSLFCPGNPYGLSFSADNSKLYVSFQSINSSNLIEQFNAVYQYDVSSENISQTAVGLIANNPNTNINIDTKIERGGPGAFALQLAPDGRIYSGYHWLSPSGKTNLLLTIDKPNLSGFNCEINLKEFNFGLAEPGPLLPNFIEAQFNGVVSRSICELSSSFHIYPNPTYSEVNLSLLEGCESIYHLNVYNSIGQVMFSKQIISPEAILNISELNPGLYVFIVSTEYGNDIVRRIIKK